MTKSITRAALLAVVAGSLTSVFATPAQAQVSVAEGRRCGFASEYDPLVEGDTQTGEMHGGPLTATAPAATITLRCTIQSGAANSTHAGADEISASSGAMLQTAVVPPVPIQYQAPEGQPVYMCTQATINGVDYYWDATAPGVVPGTVDGAWSTSSSAGCNEAISQETYPKGGACDQPVHLHCTTPANTKCFLWIGGVGGLCVIPA